MMKQRWGLDRNVLTETCCDRHRIRDQRILDIETRMANTLLKRTRKPKLLGVILDEKLTFHEHVKAVEMNAQKVLSALRILGKTEKNMVRLYKSIVVLQLEYAASVWKAGRCEILDRVQRRGLTMCLRVPAAVSWEALEVEAGMLPQDLRREVLAVSGSVGVRENLRKAKRLVGKVGA